MTLVSDFAGGWEFHGIVTPKYEEWTNFPIPSTSNSSVIRLTFYGERNKVRSYGLIRVGYDTGNMDYSPPKRIYFSEEAVIIRLDIPEEFLINAEVVSRTIQVKKDLFGRFKKWTGLITDESWGLGLESLESPAIPASLATALQGNSSILNLGGSGGIIVVLNSQS